ncbi:CAP domain-containing protein [Rhodococcus sp. B10]|uniref:CAP domain-containing protein n=1 Tax=Rhodococcus sp. B10 TaxID=2695876 RepID=UPI0014313523|nr:CAP domain-containing protein [Rhodococcus sp. B10]NIL77141.1 hypothetical protein [Rhodococcus sp. B10]
MSSDYRRNSGSAAKRWSSADLFLALSLGSFVATLLIVFLGLHFSGTAEITPTASSTSTPPAANALERLVNEQRQDHDLPAIKSNAALRESACAKAADMQDKDYFEHVAPDGTQPWKFFDEAGYRYAAAGENLARNFSDDTDLVQAWMDSPTHRENVLGEYKEQGICTVGAYTVQHLGVAS